MSAARRIPGCLEDGSLDLADPVNRHTTAFLGRQTEALKRIDVRPDGTMFTREPGEAVPTLGEMLWAQAARMVIAEQS